MGRGLLIGVLSLLALGTLEARDFTLWPIFSYEEWEGRREVRALGPFFFWEEGEGRVSWGVRPVVSRSSHGPSWRWEILYPLGRMEKGADGTRGYFFPLYGKRDRGFSSFFTLYWGRDREGRPYWGLFPFFGTMRDALGRDRVDFFLWPLWSRTEEGGSVTTKVLWPLLKVYEGEVAGWDLFPLCGKRKGGGREEGFFLWPLYVWQDRVGPEGPYRFRLYFPLYGEIEAPRASSHFVLPPFFHLRRYRDGGRVWEVWPFIRFGPHERKAFPLFWEREEEGSRSLWFFWPLYGSRRDRVGGGEVRRERYLLLSGREEVVRGGQRVSSRFTLWPLFSSEKGEGWETFSLPYPVPLRDEGLERNLYPLFTLVKYERTPQGAQWDFLWGLIRERKGADKGFFRVAFLLERSWGEVQEVKFLMGLISVKKEGGRWKVRLLDLF